LKNPVDKSAGVIRLFSSTLNDHFYTTENGERDAFIAKGYKFEGLIGFILTAQLEDSIPLYRLFHPTNNDHFYTTSESEKTFFLT